MSAKKYIPNMIFYINSRPNLKKCLLFLDKYAPLPITWAFYINLAYLALTLDFRVFYVGLIPGVTFFTISALRKHLNYKRPFEELGFEPLLPHSPGTSCPSLHATSSATISMATYYICPPAGVIIGFLSIIICATRVLTGVHYPRDVIWGAGIGAVVGYIGFFIIL